MASSDASHLDVEIPLLDGAVDFSGRKVNRSSFGGWRSASFIIGVEVAERFAFYGISFNLMIYLTGPLGQSTVRAAESVNLWSGTTTMLPLVGAFIADSFLGRYRTIVIASLIYILGLGMLSATAMLPLPERSSEKISSGVASTSVNLRLVLFYLSLYIIAIAQSGHKPCVQAFGADQFDGDDSYESKAKSSFFNWWYFCMNAGILVSTLSLPYIMDNLNWALGFGIPCVIMVVALAIFLMGTKTYRFVVRTNEKSAFARIGSVFCTAAKNWQTSVPHQGSEQFKFLNKALYIPAEQHGKNKCTAAEVEEARAVLRLGPIWASCLIYGIVFAQSSTFFTKQGSTMDRSTRFGINIPAASLQSFIAIAIMVLMPIYDLAFIPVARKITGKLSGITMLQRIGTGMVISALSMLIAALVEQKRLKMALGINPLATVPMSVWWLIPQYLLFGVADVFTMVGLQEFFYDQVPTEVRSMGLSLYLSIFGIGNFLSSLLIYVVEYITSRALEYSWFSDDLNLAHLDYFYWLLAGLSFLGFAIYVNSAKAYIYNRAVAL
ncbi:hypothetical protein QQ045_009011 [Rhodiola kirilowii]